MAYNTSFSARKKTGVSYETIIREVRAGELKPVYFLMGEESYYIDRVSDFIVDAVLKKDERDFNLLTFFGMETDIDTVINAAKGFPMGAQRLVVMVKEAQGLKNLERLAFYLKSVQPSTVLIFCYKNGKIDQRLKVASMIEKQGVLYESPKLNERQLVAFIKSYAQRKRIGIEEQAVMMLAEYVGNDLNRMAGELDKLFIALPEGQKIVTEAMVQSHVGISKEFNIFELQEALGRKDIAKVMLIAKYFDSNPKVYNIQKTLPMLFKYFSNVMLAYYSPDKSEHGIGAWLGMSEWGVRKNVLPPMKAYSGVKVMKIIGEIRRTDARSKGVDSTSSTTCGELMRELFYFILH